MADDLGALTILGESADWLKAESVVRQNVTIAAFTWIDFMATSMR